MAVAQALIRVYLLFILAVNPLHRGRYLHRGSSTSASPSLDRVLSSKPRSPLHRNRKHKDPLKPKHPILAFLVYVNERRAAFREENKNVLEVTKMTGELEEVVRRTKNTI
ncbi:hypothetical protein Bca52824_080361 [Brassica carinata]|uniref:Uncharacterized protein n=1 Tax=Brassica carinata TaxID=52824 RepID=A0A8X7PFD0_BRACI|nr:hypothetical protein Bca52824_080361 [Brassica carinata]